MSNYAIKGTSVEILDSSESSSSASVPYLGCWAHSGKDMFRLTRIGTIVLLLSLISSPAYCEEFTTVELPRTSYSITYTSTDSITILCIRVNSCVVNVHVNGKNFSFNASDLKVKTISPRYAALGTHGEDKRENAFSFRVSTSCDNKEKKRHAACYTYAEIMNGNISRSYTEGRDDIP